MSKDNLENEIDALFRLPLAEFTGARNALAARLKKRGADSSLIKALLKPSISAWAVNQLYWNQRDAFDQLIKSGERFHKAQTSGKVADMHSAMEARRELLTTLSDLATSILQDAGHNPAPDTIRRITTTLEALSAYAQRADGRHSAGPGRLHADVDPPGFELFGSSIPSAGMKRQETDGGRQVAGGGRQAIGIAHSRDNKRQVEESHKARIAAAKVSLQDAKRLLTQARAASQSLEAAQKKADAEAKKAEQRRRDAEESFEKAKAASEAAARRARNVAAEVEEAASALEDAEVTVEKASKELEKLSGE
ncbi:MAG: hypothetical protein WAL47_14255 [Pyrinomonadaceae bacterium]